MFPEDAEFGLLRAGRRIALVDRPSFFGEAASLTASLAPRLAD